MSLKIPIELLGDATSSAVRPLTVRTRQAGYAEKLSDVTLKQFQAALEHGNLVDPLKTQEIAGVGSAAALSQTVLTAGGMLAGKPPFRPLPPGESGFWLKSTAAAALSERTRATLGHRVATLSEQPLDRLVASLQDEVEAAGKEIEALHGSPVRRSVKRCGDTLVIIATPAASPWTATTTGLSLGSLPTMPPMESSIPTGCGPTRPPTFPRRCCTPRSRQARSI